MVARTPNGVAVQYNDATYIVWAYNATDMHRLFTKKDGDLIAKIPGDWAIEWARPCAVTPPDAAPMTPASAVAFLGESLSRLRDGDVGPGWLAAIKAELEKFNRQRWTWRK